MSDDLAIGAPGTTSVLTTELVEESSRLTRLSEELEQCQRELLAIDQLVGWGILGAADAPHSALLAEEAIDEANVAIRSARESCDHLARGLAVVAHRYEDADRVVARLEQQLSAELAHALGVLAPVILALLLPGGIVAGTGCAIFMAALPERSRSVVFSSLGGWLRSKSSALTDPHLVTAVRYSVMSVDDVGWGLAGVPPLVAQALGDEGLGIFGADTSAGVVVGVGAGSGLLRETGVRVTAKATAHGVSNAEQIKDRVERIPADAEQVRIDRYSTPGVPDRFEVYIAGTADGSLTSGAEPWDMTSNVAAMAGGSNGEGAGSYRAVAEAMRSAGIDASSPVTITGYSQGGLIAAQLAASGDYAVDGLITLGAPAGQVRVPHDIPYLAMEHTDDLVPALGGTFASSDPIVVSRRVFDHPPPVTDIVLPAHQLSNYLDTACLIDNSTNGKLEDLLKRLSHPRAPTVSSTVFFAERVKP